MRYWVTPFQLSATALSTLNAAGLQPWPAEGWSALPDAECLLLYDSPDRLIAMVGSGPETEGLTAQSLLQGYRRLLDWSERPGQPLLAISQLQRLGPGALRSWFDDGDDAFPSPASPLPIPPLLASVCLSLLVDEPALLDCYHDLELRAALLGRDPDLRYRERLLQAGQQGNAQLQTLLASQRLQAASSVLEKRLAHRDTELREAREASEQTLQQLHQVQGALERSVQADAEKQRQLEAGVRELEELQSSKAELESAHDLAKAAQKRAYELAKAAQEREHDQDKAAQQREHDQELEALRQRLEPRLADLEQRLASRDAELREAREEAAMTLQQLHQLQEQLVQNFLADAEKQRQLEAGVRDLEELRRSKADQESAHEQAKAAQQRAHDQELEALRQQFEPRLAELEQRLASRDVELRQARETAEMSLLELDQQVQKERALHAMADAEKQRQLEAGVCDLEQLRRSKADQESHYEQAKAAQQRAHDQELEALRQQLQPQLADLAQRLASRDAELREALQEAAMTLQQLHQLQEDLEQYLLADAEKQRQLEAGVRDLEALRRSKADQESNHEQATAAQQRAHDQELEALRQQLEPRLFELEQRLASRETELRQARETAEMSLLQLHQQVQEELERHAMAEVEKQRQLEAAVHDLEQLRRIKTDQESAHEQATAAQQRAHVQELEVLRQQLEPRLAELEQRLAHRDAELRQARETAEMSLLQLHQQVQDERKRHAMAEGVMQRQLEAGVRDLEQLRRIKTDQESAHERAKAAQQRAHDQELEALRQQLEPRLAELQQRLASRDTELRQATETAEMSLMQLHQQVQEERELHSMAEGVMQRQLEAGVRDLEQLRRLKTAEESAHAQARAELEQGLASRDTQLRQAREEAELTFQQLHQAQEELEHYFLKARAGDQLAQAQLEQLQRAQSLMVRLNPDVLPNAPYPAALAVEVLPELPAAMPDPSLQTQALLGTYAASLQRASALLERARRS